MMNKYENEDLIADKIARKLGFIDFPSDSIEQGDIWHRNPDIAPFGPTISKRTFREFLFDGCYSLKLIEEFRLNIHHEKQGVEISSDDKTLTGLIATKPVHIAVVEYLSGEELVKCQ